MTLPTNSAGPIVETITTTIAIPSSPGMRLGQADDAPLHVSLAAVLVFALCVCWDRRSRERHQSPAR